MAVVQYLQTFYYAHSDIAWISRCQQLGDQLGVAASLFDGAAIAQSPRQCLAKIACTSSWASDGIA
jgi:hypothetical protein